MATALLLGLLLQSSAARSADLYHPPAPMLSTCSFAIPPTAVARSLRDLPTDAQDELTRQFGRLGGLADAGGAFEATDNITNPSIPRQRFVRGYRFGDRWIVWIEIGGLVRNVRTIGLRPQQDARTGKTSYHLEHSTNFSGNLCKATQAILDGVMSNGG